MNNGIQRGVGSVGIPRRAGWFRSGLGTWLTGLGLGLGMGMAPTSGHAAESTVLEFPATGRVLHLRVEAPESLAKPGAGFHGGGTPGLRHAVQWAPSVGSDGLPVPGRRDALVTLPPNVAEGASTRRLQLRTQTVQVESSGGALFRWGAVDDRSLGLWEGDRPVFVYRHGTMLKPGVPADRARSSYVHPLFGLDGEVLTDDFPEDHHHHRGLFWSWPRVGVDGKEHDLWALKGIAHRFERWLARETGSVASVLGVENGWYVGETRVLKERIWITTYAVTGESRAVDLDCVWIPEGRAITLTGAEGKSYGGLTLRYAPGTNTVITTPRGNGTTDLYMTPLPWADLARQFVGRSGLSGAAIFVGPDHPDYPPTWLTRHYGVLCLGWPGVQSKVFPAGEPFRCRYRVWIHRGVLSQAVLESEYASYREGRAVGFGKVR